jgi:hypothetical protein
MARRKKRRGQGLGAYFRGVFQERPHWLHEKSNDLMLVRYREDHGLSSDQALAPSVRNTLANLKSKMRREEREGGAALGRDAPRAPERFAELPPDNDPLTQLEEQIDDCLTLARNLGREGFDDVIGYLRRARNEVVWKMGQP